MAIQVGLDPIRSARRTGKAGSLIGSVRTHTHTQSVSHDTDVVHGLTMETLLALPLHARSH